MAGASRLLHTIVVIGASMGCGSGRLAPDPADASKDAPGPPDAPATRDGPSIRTLCDCARPGTFRCKACASGKAPQLGRCPDNDGEECSCDESVAIATPTDCAHPEQFECALEPGSTDTTNGFGFASTDWFAFANCSCDAARPITASQCDAEQFEFLCAQPWGCSDPAGDGGLQTVAYACACLPYPIPIR